MKKFLFFFFFFFIFLKSNAQIIYEHTFYRPPTEFYITDIGNNDLKYIFQDSSGFTMYNLDYTIYQQVPTTVPLGYSYIVAYVTKSLFDCDTTNLEYMITAPFGGPLSTYIYRTDGTLLFQKDSVTGPYNIAAADGSTWEKPIFNTPMGTKMWLIQDWGNQDSLWVYSLCGSLPDQVMDFTGLNQFSVSLYPDPAISSITFKIRVPDNLHQYELKINDSSGNEIYREKIFLQKDEYVLNVKNMSSGNYFYTLGTQNKPVKAGKFILTK